jgi:glycerol-3-phosphate dehydrogenase (NAD(P)+)
MNLSILGAGAWGTALAIHLHRNGHTVTLLPRRLEHATTLATTRENTPYLPGHPLHPDIQIAHNPRPPLMESDALILACPSHGLRELTHRLAPALDRAPRPRLLVTLAKGLEEHTLLRPSQILAQTLPHHPHAALSGPTNAGEIARALPTAIILATHPRDEPAARPLRHALHHPATLRVYPATDIPGVELGGILKNIYAIGAGACDGLHLGANAKAAYLTHALHEMVRLGTATGGRPETFYGLSGIGDLIATATATWSRNRALGQALATHPHETPAHYLAASPTAVEGYRATASIHTLARQHHIHTPILDQIHALLYGHKSAPQALATLMQHIPPLTEQ